MYADSYIDCAPRETHAELADRARDDATETIACRIYADVDRAAGIVSESIVANPPEAGGAVHTTPEDALASILIVLHESFRALHGLDTGEMAQEAMTRLRELSGEASKFVDSAIQCEAAKIALQQVAA